MFNHFISFHSSQLLHTNLVVFVSFLLSFECLMSACHHHCTILVKKYWFDHQILELGTHANISVADQRKQPSVFLFIKKHDLSVWSCSILSKDWLLLSLFDSCHHLLIPYRLLFYNIVWVTSCLSILRNLGPTFLLLIHLLKQLWLLFWVKSLMIFRIYNSLCIYWNRWEEVCLLLNKQLLLVNQVIFHR